jgi:hypothetical protein
VSKPLSTASISAVLRDHLSQYSGRNRPDSHLDIALQNTKVIDFDRLKQIMPLEKDQQNIFKASLRQWDAIAAEIQGDYEAKNWKQLAVSILKHKGSFSYLADSRLDEAMGMLYNYLTHHQKLDEKTISAMYQLIRQEMTALKKAVTQEIQDNSLVQS